MLGGEFDFGRQRGFFKRGGRRAHVRAGRPRAEADPRRSLFHQGAVENVDILQVEAEIMNRKCVSFGVSIAVVLLTAHAAIAQSSEVEALKRRMSDVETKLDAIYDLLQKQNAPSLRVKPVPSASSSASASDAPAGYVPGMYLDVFASGLVSRTYDDLPGEPAGFPSGSVTIEPRNAFAYGALLEEGSLKNFASTSNSLVGVRFSGKLRIGSVGPHSFQIAVNNTSQGWQFCISTISLSGQKIAEVKLIHGYSANSQEVKSLSSGLYDYSIFIVCKDPNGGSNGSAVRFRSIAVAVLMAEPGDRAPKPIPTDRFFIKAR